jgi:hypothetical protein
LLWLQATTILALTPSLGLAGSVFICIGMAKTCLQLKRAALKQWHYLSRFHP